MYRLFGGFMCQIIVNGKRCQILKDTLDLSVPVNTALVDLQLKRKDSASSLCYYARHFCGYLLGKGITDLADVTAADLRFFAEELVSAGKSAAVVNAYASLIGEIFNARIAATKTARATHIVENGSINIKT